MSRTTGKKKGKIKIDNDDVDNTSQHCTRLIMAMAEENIAVKLTINFP